jgi:hypothetical protein
MAEDYEAFHAFHARAVRLLWIIAMLDARGGGGSAKPRAEHRRFIARRSSRIR